MHRDFDDSKRITGYYGVVKPKLLCNEYGKL